MRSGLLARERFESPKPDVDAEVEEPVRIVLAEVVGEIDDHRQLGGGQRLEIFACVPHADTAATVAAQP